LQYRQIWLLLLRNVLHRTAAFGEDLKFQSGNLVWTSCFTHSYFVFTAWQTDNAKFEQNTINLFRPCYLVYIIVDSMVPLQPCNCIIVSSPCSRRTAPLFIALNCACSDPTVMEGGRCVVVNACSSVVRVCCGMLGVKVCFMHVFCVCCESLSWFYQSGMLWMCMYRSTVIMLFDWKATEVQSSNNCIQALLLGQDSRRRMKACFPDRVL